MCGEARVLLPALLLSVLLLLGAEQGHDPHPGVPGHPGAPLPPPRGQARGPGDHRVPARGSQETLHRLICLQKEFHHSQYSYEVGKQC